MRFIPTKVHGILDYVVGVALIAARGCSASQTSAVPP